MTTDQTFHSLEGWEPTRDTLHWYSKGVAAVPRAHAEFHPKWWHVSLMLVQNGLMTDEMSLPGGGFLRLKMNLFEHKVEITSDRGVVEDISMNDGLTSTELADHIFKAVAALGLVGKYERSKFENDEPRHYKKDHAEKYLNTLKIVKKIFEEHRASISGNKGPVQFWAHHFDLAFEWFGTRMIESGEGDNKSVLPSQLSLGFAPGDYSHPEPYFYSNPWPFETMELRYKDLPKGARWNFEPWQGTLLPYKELVGDENGKKRLLEYARTVYDIAEPTLLENKLLSKKLIR